MITMIHSEPEALEKREKISDARELYIEAQELVEFIFEMDDERAWEAFNQLPEHVLPILPEGYRWAIANENYSIICNQNAAVHDIKIVLYGPDINHDINFIYLLDGVTTYSFAHTKKNNNPGKSNPPMSLRDFKVVGYDYSTHRYSGHVRGHLIDHQDTILNVPTLSTNDPRNFNPEPPEYEWGMGIRRLKVKALRDLPGSGAYAQFNCFGDAPLITSNGTKVPEDVRLYSFKHDTNYSAIDVFHVAFEENMKRRPGQKVLEHAADNLTSDLEASPIVASYSPDISDRGLRLKVRNLVKKELAINNQQCFSRFIDKDRLFAAYDKADDEFESAGHQLHAGILTKTDGVSINYIKRSLFFADKLGELDDKEVLLYSADDVREGRQFFRTTDKDLDDMSDKFKQLISLQKNS